MTITITVTNDSGAEIFSQKLDRVPARVITESNAATPSAALIVALLADRLCR